MIVVAPPYVVGSKLEDLTKSELRGLCEDIKDEDVHPCYSDLFLDSHSEVADREGGKATVNMYLALASARVTLCKAQLRFGLARTLR